MMYLGHSCLEFMKRQGTELVFDDWKANVQHAAPDFDLTACDEEWLWAWESLRQSKSTTERFGKLRAAGVRWKDSRERFDCLPVGAEFAVALKHSELDSLRSLFSDPTVKPKVVVNTVAPLRMKPGKANRLECCDAACEVTISVSSAHTSQKEADLMRIEMSEIDVIDNLTVRAKAKSLNQAYTIASRRLEPERRGHGGRIYDRFVYVDRTGRTTQLLDDIRGKLETNSWVVPKETEAVKNTGASDA